MTADRSPEMTGIIADFVRSLREKIAAMTADGDMEDAIEKIFAAAAAVGAAILMAVPKTRNRGVVISSLLAVAMKLFTRKEQRGRHQEPPPDPSYVPS